MDLIQVLHKSLGSDRDELLQAQELLENYAKSNLAEFLKVLSEILRNAQVDGFVRMAAGLQFKNQLTSKDEVTKKHLQQQWVSLPQDLRNVIKNNVLGGLAIDHSLVNTNASCQCVAYIASIELPLNQWPDLIQNLTQGATAQTSSESMKVSCLETIGYICAELPTEYLSPQSNQILTAIINNMGQSTTNNTIRYAAANAFLNSLEFTKANFNTEDERHFIMQVVCEATQCSELKVRVAALQCLVKIMSLYYVHMEQYMRNALFAITMDAIKSENPECSLQGIEFWSNVCDEEIELSVEASEAAEQGRPPTRSSKFYAKGALVYLCPLLLEVLCNQDEDADQDDWNPYQAAGVCLILLASCTGNDIMAHVMPFVEKNITSENWHLREAAMMAFGSVLDGPDEEILIPIVQQALPTIITLMGDPNLTVRDTTSWVLSKICEQISSIMLNPDVLSGILDVFIKALQSEPRVAVNICWALNSLSEAVNDEACANEDVLENPQTNKFSKYFDVLVHNLLQCTERPDAHQNNLRSSAYEALMEMIKNSAQDNYVTVQQTTMIMLERLNRVLGLENHNDQNVADLQSLLCSTLQAVMRKMTPEDAPKIADPIMNATVQMLDYGIKTGLMNDDALLIATTLADTIGEGFLKYMAGFQQYLLRGLKTFENPQLCSVSIGVVSDLSHALGEKIAPYVNDIMTALTEVLANDVPQKVKTEVLSVFGDIAMNIGEHFKPYLLFVLQTLNSATMAPINRDSQEAIDYCNDLWEGTLHAYTGIVQGLKGDGNSPASDVQLLTQHITNIAQFLVKVADHYLELPDTIICSLAGLIGDLISIFGSNLMILVEQNGIQAMFARGKRSKIAKTRNMVAYGLKQINRVKALTAGMPQPAAFQNAMQSTTLAES